MECQRCKSDRIADVTGKTDDRCIIRLGQREHIGYVPRDMRIGGGDYLRLSYCLECGQMQNRFPVGSCDMEELSNEE